MYKVFPVDGGWHVYWLESPDAEPKLVPRPTDDPEERLKPYSKRQAAYRRSKKLNDLNKKIDEQIARDGAIIV